MPKNTTGLTLQAMRRKTKLSFGGRGAYAVESLESGQFSEQEIRREYSRLRSIMNKRLSRLESSSEWQHTSREETPVSLSMKNYPKLKDLENPRDVAEKLRDLAAAIESPLSTFTGLEQVRSRSLETLHENYPETEGIVTEENFKEFTQFMNKVHKVTKARGFYNDEEMIALFGQHVKKKTKYGSLIRSFYRYMEKQEAQVDKIPPIRR